MIYILINPSFPSYVKIGYADNIEERLRELNRSECIPFAFRVYAIYEVNSRLSDLKIHSIIDKLNPNLRSIENFNGRKRVREFYAMSPEDAYSILKSISEINGCTDKLRRIKPNKIDAESIDIAEDVEEKKNEKLKPFSFSLCSIPIGSFVEYCSRRNEKSGLMCKVIDDRHIEYNGEKWSLSSLATTLKKSRWSVAGTRYFKYKGKWLNDIRKQFDK